MDVHTCTSGICGLAHTRFADVRTCTSGICRLAHTRFAEVQLFPRGCHVVATWQPRGNNCTSANRVCASPQIAYVQVRKSHADVHVFTSANRVCASPQIPDVHVCTSANRACASPQIPDVHVSTSANRVYVHARHDSRDLYRATVLGLRPSRFFTFAFI